MGIYNNYTPGAGNPADNRPRKKLTAAFAYFDTNW
jgi:hypothetical protein